MTTAPAATGPRYLPFDEYAAINAVNWSTLKHLRTSPLHYKEAKQGTDGKDTPARRLGRITHTALFEPDRLAADYLVYTENKVKDPKAWAAFKKEHASRCIVSNEELWTARAIADAVRKHPLAAALLTEGWPEACLEWTDPMTRLKLKGRVDWLAPRVVTDLKTSRHAVDARRFASEAFTLGYFHQSAFYGRGARAVSGLQQLQPRIIAVEPSPPFDVAVYPIAADALQAVNEDIDDMLVLLAECLDSGKRPGKFAEAQPLELPHWAFAEDEEEPVVDDSKPNPTWHGRA